MRVVAFNAWSSGNRDIEGNLLDLAEATERPEIIALQELKHYRGTIRGYQRVASDEGHREDANCALFVHRSVRIIRADFLRIDAPRWRGPKQGAWHPPRVYPWIVGDLEGERFEVMSVHRAPGGPTAHMEGAAENWAAEHRALVAWFARRNQRRPDRIRLAAGDWNCRKWDMREATVSHLARLVSGRAVIKGIDGAVTTNAAAKGFKLPDLYGSDAHRPVVVDVRPKDC